VIRRPEPVKPLDVEADPSLKLDAPAPIKFD
jgi:hypothetical protein